MGATTVTGQSGRGIAYGNRGPGNKRNYFVPNAAPHVVAAGIVATDGGGGATVVLADPLTGGRDNYVVTLQIQGLANDTAAANGSFTLVKNVITNAAGNVVLSGFTVASATVSAKLGWQITTVGQGFDSVVGVEVNNLVGTTVATNL